MKPQMFVIKRCDRDEDQYMLPYVDARHNRLWGYKEYAEPFPTRTGAQARINQFPPPWTDILEVEARPL